MCVYLVTVHLSLILFRSLTKLIYCHWSTGFYMKKKNFWNHADIQMNALIGNAIYQMNWSVFKRARYRSSHELDHMLKIVPRYSAVHAQLAANLARLPVNIGVGHVILRSINFSVKLWFKELGGNKVCSRTLS